MMTRVVDVHQVTQEYEAWLRAETPILEPDLKKKHRKMRKHPFAFLRGTFYRWAQLFPRVCGNLQRGPRVLAVGDLHVENFGTWRDREGRLIWGVNDFDEAYWLPVANDLVRLAVSADLAKGIRLDSGAITQSILSGYRHALKIGGYPYVLSERHVEMRALAMGHLKDPERYWRELCRCPEVEEEIPAGAREGIEALMPAEDLPVRIVHRQSGLGSLGRERFTAIAEWAGGSVAREAKALAPSAWAWAWNGKAPRRRLHAEILGRAVRCPDPFVMLHGRWVIRRLAPDCSRIELDSLPRGQDQRRLLRAMGAETGNVHLGSASAGTLLRYLGRLPRRWLFSAVGQMSDAIRADWRRYASRAT
jgi:Uncharacterized protein conserved in bacteria (DUF2252)